MCWEIKDMAIIFSAFSCRGLTVFIWVATLQNINVLFKKKYINGDLFKVLIMG